jgi:hypothetical protein
MLPPPSEKQVAWVVSTVLSRLSGLCSRLTFKLHILILLLFAPS